MGHHCAEQPDRTRLEASYAYSRAVTRHHSKTFFLASGLLPQPKRDAVRALYGFCRHSDDLVDVAGDRAGEQFMAWREKVLGHMRGRATPSCWPGRIPGRRYRFPLYVEQFLHGLALDLTRRAL